MPPVVQAEIAGQAKTEAGKALFEVTPMWAGRTALALPRQSRP